MKKILIFVLAFCLFSCVKPGYIHNFSKAYYAQQEDMLKTYGEWKYTIDNPEPGAKDL
jgi:hypothetical protein